MDTSGRIEISAIRRAEGGEVAAMSEMIQSRRWALDPKTFQVIPEDDQPVSTFTAQEWRAQQWPPCPICGEVGEPQRVDVREFADRFPKFMIGAWECLNDCDPRGPTVASMSDEAADAKPCPCGYHELRTITEIGDWTHGSSPTVREWATRPDIWAEGRCKIPHEELHRLIKEAGGISCEYALEAISGAPPRLYDGAHRWAVAAELGIGGVPVKMLQESPFAYAG